MTKEKSRKSDKQRIAELEQRVEWLERIVNRQIQDEQRKRRYSHGTDQPATR